MQINWIFSKVQRHTFTHEKASNWLIRYSRSNFFLHIHCINYTQCTMIEKMTLVWFIYLWHIINFHTVSSAKGYCGCHMNQHKTHSCCKQVDLIYVLNELGSIERDVREVKSNSPVYVHYSISMVSFLICRHTLSQWTLRKKRKPKMAPLEDNFGNWLSFGGKSQNWALCYRELSYRLTTLL